MIDWKPNPEGGLEAELHHGGFRAYLWAWPIGYEGRHSARATIEPGGEND